MDRNWHLSENETVGSVVTRVRADDAEKDSLTFGLEPLLYGNLAYYNKTSNGFMPFKIDENTGTVYLEENLMGRVSESPRKFPIDFLPNFYF